MIRGFATPEGTATFATRHKNSVKEGHFLNVNGLSLSSIGMGTYLGDLDGRTDGLVEEAVRVSVSSGSINVLDTAINYRSQKAERSVGRAVKGLIDSGEIRREEVFISTKNGYLTGDADAGVDFIPYVQRELIDRGVIKPSDISQGHHCMATSYLEDQLERSRRNLGLECIDLMYLHNAAEGQLPYVGRERFMKMLKEAFLFYEKKRKEGRIRHYGVATWECFRAPEGSPAYLNLENVVRLAQEAGGRSNGFAFVQLPINMAMDEALREKNQRLGGKSMTFMEAARRLGVGVFSSVPLLQGQLLRSSLPDVDDIGPPALRCLQFVRKTGSIPLVGQKSPEHVRENINISSIPL